MEEEVENKITESPDKRAKFRPCTKNECWGCENYIGRLGPYDGRTKAAEEICEFYNKWKSTIPMQELCRDVHKIWRQFVYLPAIVRRQECADWPIGKVEEHFKDHL